MGSISSHRGRIRLEGEQKLPVLHFAISWLENAGLPNETKTEIHSVYSVPHLIDEPNDRPMDISGTYSVHGGETTIPRRIVYLVAYRDTRDINARGTNVEVSGDNWMELHVAHNPLAGTSGYISVIAGYDKPNGITLTNGEGLEDVLTFVVSAACNAAPDPDSDPDPNSELLPNGEKPPGLLEVWPNCQLTINLLQIDYTTDDPEQWALFHADWEAVKTQTGKATRLNTILGKNNTTLSYIEPDAHVDPNAVPAIFSPGLRRGMYILARPTTATQSA